MTNNIIMEMFNNTDANGLLYLNGWPINPEEITCIPRFVKCRMNWDVKKVQEIDAEAQNFCQALETLGRYFAENGLNIYTKPDLTSFCDEEVAAHLLNVWKLFCGGYNDDELDIEKRTALAEQRLGGKINAYNTFIYARRILNLILLNSPDFIVDTEIYRFVHALTLTRACEELTGVDITNDSYNSETHTLGEFREDDIRRVVELIESDCTVIPDVEMGYTLLVNKILEESRIDIYRRAKTFKPIVDELLAALTNPERDVLKKVYGLTDGERKTYGQTAVETNIQVPIVKSYEEDAIWKLRQTELSKLKDVLFRVE